MPGDKHTILAKPVVIVVVVLLLLLFCYCLDILNETVINPDHPYPDTPDNTFLIKNLESHTCLAPSSTRKMPSNPINYHSHEALYPLSLVTCDLASQNQQWQWTMNDSLLHIATFLCLGVHYERREPKLVLRTCKMGDLGQKWNCATNHIKQPDTWECITASAVEGGQGNRKRRKAHEGAVEEDSLRENLIRYTALTSSVESDDQLRVVEAELGEVIQELQNLHKQREQVNSGSFNNNNDRAQVEESVDTRYNTVFEFCVTASNLQKWTIVDSEGDDNQSSICSRSLSLIHNLPYCYPSDMESASGASHTRLRWASCSHSGYYVSGFYHTYNIEGYEDREKGLISAIKCCAGNYVFTGHENTLIPRGEEICEEREWWERMEHSDHLFTKGWFTCPRGMYLKGFLLSTQLYNHNENLIRTAKCCRPVDGPETYIHCYPDRAVKVIDTEVHACRMRGYHIVAVVRKNCDYSETDCEEILTCCM